jgi:NADH-quinone oxidoreductase subunit C
MEDVTVKRIKEAFPGAITEEIYFRGEATVVIRRESLVELCRFLKEDDQLQYEYLSDLCGVDWLPGEPRFEVVYNLYSIKNNTRIRIKVPVHSSDCRVPTVTGIWQTANWHERETHDMFGIRFEGHPGLCKILLPDEFVGYPLRKDYPVSGKQVD